MLTPWTYIYLGLTCDSKKSPLDSENREKMVVSCRTTTRPNDGTNLWSKPSARPARIALLLILERGGQLSGCQTIKLGSGLTYRTSRNSGFRPGQSLRVVVLRDGCSARVAGTKDPSEPSRTSCANDAQPPVLNILTSPCQDRGRLGRPQSDPTETTTANDRWWTKLQTDFCPSIARFSPVTQSHLPGRSVPIRKSCTLS